MKKTRRPPGSLLAKLRLATLLCAAITLLPDASVFSQTNKPSSPTGDRSRVNERDAAARIRDEGLNHSQVMQTIGYLTDVIGPRLTGSPQLKRANEWTRARLQSWGLTNANLEAWGPFGYGWTLERFSAHVVAPDYFPLKAYPNAWSPGLNGTLTANVIYLDATNTAQLQKYNGKLKGAVVLASPARDVPARFEAPARRLDVTNLLGLANASVEVFSAPPNPSTPARGPRSARQRDGAEFAAPATNSIPTAATNAPAPPRRRPPGWARFLPFLKQEGVALILTPSNIGDAGTIFVTGAAVPITETEFINATNSNPSRLTAYATNAPAIPPQVTVAVEDYNRLVRMTQLGEQLKVSAELKVRFHTNDLMAYNTVAEIPGSDLKDEVVMLGAHLDSWHSGTGATDNGSGTAVVMEAVRIIKALNLQPRRTIRVALWGGEEQGLLGSKAYVAKHFGHYVTNTTAGAGVRSPRDADNDGRRSRADRARSSRKLVKEDGYEKLSGYFNLDNGAGKIRGIYMQGNEAVRPYFRKWLEPFRDLGAETITPGNTGSTDHISFNNLGLPGFEFLQDPLDYQTRTHHSNEDVLDRIQPDDLKQASVIMAAFVYNAAMLDEKLPRKPAE